MIISPTRELAMQIFEVIRVVADYHMLNVALLTGGKDFRAEQGVLDTVAVVVGTPGRILQHLEQSPNFSCSDLQALVLDEADRILDMGFQHELNNIIEYLPQGGERQTMLFSATQTKSVKQLARLSLSNPEYIAVHEQSRFATPERLEQNYTVVELQNKLDIVWSFLRTHLKSKTLVFSLLANKFASFSKSLGECAPVCR